MTRRLSILLALLALLSGCSGVGNSGSTNGYVSGDGSVTVVDAGHRAPAPALSGTDLAAQPLALADYSGQVVVVNVWGSWCLECREEAPTLAAVARQYRGKNVQFVGMLARDNLAAAQAFDRRQHMPYPTFSDVSGRMQLEFVDSLPAQAIPTTWVIDKRHRVAARIAGKVDAKTLGDLIDQMLAEG